jgi:hypothetical protein
MVIALDPVNTEAKEEIKTLQEKLSALQVCREMHLEILAYLCLSPRLSVNVNHST